MDVAGRLVAAACSNGEPLPVLVFDHDAKARQQLQGDGDVGLGNQLPHHVDRDAVRASRQRQRHEQGGKELARYVAAHADGRGKRQRRHAVRMGDAQWRIAIVAQVVNMAAQLTQRIDKIANRALACAAPRTARTAAQQRQRCRERAHGRAGLPES
jgi:hypothetical protein